MMFAPQTGIYAKEHKLEQHSLPTAHSPNIKLYVKLRHTETPLSESTPAEKPKKLVLLANSRAKIFELKRQIEKEFVELFPSDQPFVVAKVLDVDNYAISNVSLVGDVV